MTRRASYHSAPFHWVTLALSGVHNTKMARKALSDRVKAFNRSKVKEETLRKAVAAYQCELAKDMKDRKGSRDIAREFGIPGQYKTIQNRAKGSRSAADLHGDQQKLKPSEEDVLKNFILQSAERGFPMTLKQISDYANLVLQNREGPGYKPVGQRWAGRFIDRHHETLQTHWSKPLDTQHAQGMTPEAKRQWFELVETFVVKVGIKKENIYGMDETACPPTDSGTQRVVGARGTKTQHSQGGASRENVTAIVTICADGTTLKPTIIYKGQNFMRKWADDNASHASSVLFTS
jgi:hypothetical protein